MVVANRVLPKWVGHLVRHRVGRACEHPPFRSTDADDVEQEVWIDLLTKLDGYEPERGSLHTFVTVVVRSAIQSEMRRRHEVRRGRGRTSRSLDFLVDCGGRMVPAREVVLEREAGRRLGLPFLDREHAFDDREAIEVALQHASTQTREVCRALLDGENVASTARRLDISRRRVRRALAEARLCLTSAGFIKEADIT